jgi:geranylgeranyl reductase family protein
MAIPSECDVLVIGAGPAGSTTAGDIANSGIDVVLIDKRKELGMPVQCAEHIPFQVTHVTDSDKDIIAQKINYMHTVMPNDDVIITESKGYIIHRDLFDKVLAENARKLGTQLFTKTEALAIHRNKIKIRQGKQEQFISPKIIIDASGPKSVTGKALGIFNTSFIYANQFLMPLREKRDFTEVYFRKYIPGGYGWVFPKDNVCNVGVGVSLKFGMPPREALKKLVNELVDREIIFNKRLATVAGMIPVGGMLPLQTENILFVGDAAGQCHSITGAGVPFALLCGQLAAKPVVKSIQEEDLEIIKEYEEDCIDTFGDSFLNAVQKRQLFETYWSNPQLDFNEIVKKTWIVFEDYYK